MGGCVLNLLPRYGIFQIKMKVKKWLNNVTLACADEQPQAHSVISYTYSQFYLNIRLNLLGCPLGWEAHKVISRLEVLSSEILQHRLKKYSMF